MTKGSKDSPKKYASMELHWKLQNQTQQWIVVCYTLNPDQQQQPIQIPFFSPTLFLLIKYNSFFVFVVELEKK